MKPVYLSPERLEALKKELQELKTVTTREVAAHIDEAKQQGDLSENAEYHEAKDRMAVIQSRIAELNGLISNAEIISSPEKKSNKVHIGSTIIVQSGEIKKTFTIVGSNEADPGTGKISNESPLGEAFLGHEVGDLVVVTTPARTSEYKILEIQ